MSETLEKLPSYLKSYCTEQNYDKYTSQDHAVWRFIMRQNVSFFSKHGVPVYIEGLKKTGIPIDSIPRISEMDKALAKFGWGAVPVTGFIPPAIFLEFQARGCLPIASDMRTLDHLAYTPAPDIVHESAGHAPIIADPAYAEYLKRYAQMAQKAIMSAYDIEMYEAIRYLSDIKENPDTSPKTIEDAERRLQETAGKPYEVSESGKVARMSWWTVEYGLVGNLNNPLIYGAGLLSSVGESQACLSQDVPKIPLSVECTNVSYDITRPQPQLFVASNMEQLVTVLDEFDKTLSYRVGGVYGLKTALASTSVNSVVLDSGVTISGQLDKFLEDKSQVSFLKLSGPVQLCFQSSQIDGQGKQQHPQGFSSPLGRWKLRSDIQPSDFSDNDLKQMGLVIGKSLTLEFVNGFKVVGKIKNLTRLPNGKLGIVTWENCRVTLGEQCFFEPSWGDFDMSVGTQITSVFGGPADREAYGEYRVGAASSQPGRTSPFSKREKRIFGFFKQIREWRTSLERQQGQASELESVQKKFQTLAQEVLKDFADQWLLALELVELSRKLGFDSTPTIATSIRQLEENIKNNHKIGDLGIKGLKISHQ